ncbi:hypothetical protein TWF730_006253 [Orbilia blumenaviensis]|uniref:F-box domain-containing protein n=1 Tax=Orbilia blumenaviensis TaxID=1796055 RepID=A0AAV9VE60_9PEZI
MSGTASHRSITSLPTEIQLECLSYLTDMGSQSSLYRTCSLWRRFLRRHEMFRTARYYRGRHPYIHFPIVHRFFDISPKGNGRCKVKDGAIVNHLYRTDNFDYIDLSDVIARDPMFSPIYGFGWWSAQLAKRVQGMAVSSKFSYRSQAQAIKLVRNKADPGHITRVQEEEAEQAVEERGEEGWQAQGVLGEDARGEPRVGAGSTTIVSQLDNKTDHDAIRMYLSFGHDYQRKIKQPEFSVWERVALPKNSTVGAWTNAILSVVKLQLRGAGISVADFCIDFREAFDGSHPAEGWYLDVWIIIPESFGDRILRLGNELRETGLGHPDDSQDHGVVLFAIF